MISSAVRVDVVPIMVSTCMLVARAGAWDALATGAGAGTSIARELSATG